MSVRDWPWLLLLKRWPQVVPPAVKKILLGEPLSLANSANRVTANLLERILLLSTTSLAVLIPPKSTIMYEDGGQVFTFHGLTEIHPTIVTALCLGWNETNVAILFDVNTCFKRLFFQTNSPSLNKLCICSAPQHDFQSSAETH